MFKASPEAQPIQNSWELVGENPIKLVKIHIDLAYCVKNIPFLTAFYCFFFSMVLLMPPLVVQGCYKKLHC